MLLSTFWVYRKKIEYDRGGLEGIGHPAKNPKLRKPVTLDAKERYENLLDTKDTKTFWIQDQEQKTLWIQRYENRKPSDPKDTIQYKNLLHQ